MLRVHYGAGIPLAVAVAIAVVLLNLPSDEPPSPDQFPSSAEREAQDFARLRGAKGATTPSGSKPQGVLGMRGRVSDEEGAPVVGVRVGLRRVGPRPWDPRDTSTWTPEQKAAWGAPPFDAIDAPWGDLAFEPTREVLSGERGLFAFERLDGGEYVLQALPELPLVSDRRKLRLPSLPDQKEVVLRLTGGVALRGRVVDRDGAGVAAVVTGIMVPTAGQYRRSPPPVSSADKDGTFALRGLVAGDWRLYVVVPGKRRLASIPVDVPFDGVSTIVVDDGTGTVTGRVTATGGRGVAAADVLVTVQTAGPARYVDVRGSTNAGGRFRMESMPEGVIRRVSVRHPRFLLYDARPPDATWSGATVTAGEATTIDVALRQGTRLSGRVLEQGTGRPLAEVEVFLLERRSHNRAALPFRALSDEKGTYQIDDVPPGRRVLLARCPTHYLPPASAPSAAPVRSEEEDGAPVFVSPDPPEELLVVTAEGDGEIERDLVLAPGLEIRGRVIGPDDLAVRDAGIHLRGRVLSRTVWRWGVSWPAWTHPLATSGDDGTFSIRNLPPLETYVLYAKKAPFLPVDARPVSLSADVPTLRLAAGAVLEGRLADAGGQGVQDTITLVARTVPGRVPGRCNEWYGSARSLARQVARRSADLDRGCFPGAAAVLVGLDENSSDMRRMSRHTAPVIQTVLRNFTLSPTTSTLWNPHPL